jgi:SOS-response transcriptional repressor LexA
MDGWATGHIAKLKAGETVQFRPRGNSMTGKVDDGNLCTVEPVTDASILNVGDVVLVKVNGKVLFHLIRAIGADKRFQIANNKGFINGWVGPSAIFGRCVKVEK